METLREAWDHPPGLTFLQFFHTFERDPELVFIIESRRIVQKLYVTDIDDGLIGGGRWRAQKRSAACRRYSPDEDRTCHIVVSLVVE
jgi:hypothetical protein